MDSKEAKVSLKAEFNSDLIINIKTPILLKLITLEKLLVPNLGERESPNTQVKHKEEILAKAKYVS